MMYDEKIDSAKETAVAATEEKESLPITKKDKNLLEKFGFTDTNDWTHGEANAIISSIEQNGWRVPPDLAILQDDNWIKTLTETTKPQGKIQQSNDIQSCQSEKVQETTQKTTTKRHSPFSRAKLNETAQEIRKSEQKNPQEKSQQRKKDDMSL